MVKLVVWKILGSLTVISLVSMLWYGFNTRNMGTPLMDSLSNNQLKLLRDSAKKRKNVYMVGMVVGVLAAIYLWSRDTDCGKK